MTAGARTAAALVLADVRLTFGDVVALDGVSLDVPRGSLTAVVGPSGCGKTSLLRVAAGFERPAGGSVTLDGHCVAGPRSWVAPERRQVGMVFQEGALFPHLTVRGNVLFGLRGFRDAARRGSRVLELVGLAGLDRRFPDELSGGQQQRVALARALAPRPGIVLLDEPFASLDAALRQRVRSEVASILRAAGASALLVTHDQEEALSVADRVAVMQDGRVLQADTPEAIYRRPISAAVAELVGEGQLLPCRLSRGRLESAVGSGVSAAPDGEAWLLVRPEDLELVDPARGVARGVVTGRRFYGHDFVAEVMLDGGPSVRVRALSADEPPHGNRVGLRLRPRRYPLFARDAGGRQLGESVPTERASEAG